MGLKPRLMMVDQLWLWILDEKTVVTAFPKRWRNPNEPAFDRSDVQERIMMDLASNATKIKTASELAHVIVSKCSGTFFPTPTEVDPTGFLDFMGFFEVAIGDVKMKETRAFNRFWEHSNEMQGLQETLQARRKHQTTHDTIHKKFTDLSDKEIESRIQAEVSALTNITEETNLLKEIKDILDELNSILLIFKQQELVVQSMGKDEASEALFRDPRDPLPPHDSPRAINDRRVRFSQARLLQTVRNHKRDIETLEQEATRTHDSLTMLLDLKQKQASVLEADYARQETVETTSQGRTLLVFTTVTIIFVRHPSSPLLPLPHHRI
ncbi:hypothetical protein EJ04DRAFT_493792 [Polyplosphaeria fusca]|uniref:Uncharacterized protein n=1 Tax=Polyplosphaeria fusca TaxID=682080 RepID=A0A9P4QZE7_9PLEO|nr:hypothetical protein EJ04DRAFT_493792 [Polyplosphaeria fusca]